MVATSNGELGFDSGEGAWEMATTSKEGSRRVNYPFSSVENKSGASSRDNFRTNIISERKRSIVSSLTNTYLYFGHIWAFEFLPTVKNMCGEFEIFKDVKVREIIFYNDSKIILLL